MNHQNVIEDFIAVATIGPANIGSSMICLVGADANKGCGKRLVGEINLRS